MQAAILLYRSRPRPQRANPGGHDVAHPHARRRAAFLFGRQSALRATSDVVEQLQAALEAERAYAAGLERDRAVLQRELLEARLEIARRNIVDAFAAAPSPSAMMH